MSLLKRAEDVAQELQLRTQRITKAQGAETDIGGNIFRGRRKIDDSQVPCLVLVEGLDSPMPGPSKRNPGVKTRQSYVLVGYDKCDPDHPNDKAHAMIRDMKRAVFHDGATLGEQVIGVEYQGRDIGPRGDGVAIVSATIEIIVEYEESLQNP